MKLTVITSPTTSRYRKNAHVPCVFISRCVYSMMNAAQASMMSILPALATVHGPATMMNPTTIAAPSNQRHQLNARTSALPCGVQ